MEKKFFTPTRAGFGDDFVVSLRHGFEHPEVQLVVEVEHGPVEGLQRVWQSLLSLLPPLLGSSRFSLLSALSFPDWADISGEDFEDSAESAMVAALFASSGRYEGFSGHLRCHSRSRHLRGFQRRSALNWKTAMTAG